MPHVVLDKVNRAWPVSSWRDTTVVLAISGGADSVALLRAVHALQQTEPGQGQVIAAHFNHRLRGGESDGDEAFVESVCESLPVPLVRGAAPVPPPSESSRTFASPPADPRDVEEPPAEPAEFELAESPDRNRYRSEDKMRRARYEFLREVVASSGARFLLTAHTADDQAETVLHRILRGTGIPGLAGIPCEREFLYGVTLTRPMLTVWRSEIIDYLDGLDQPFRNDSSNASSRFTRNRLRQTLLPFIERDFNPRAKEALCRLAQLAREVSSVVDREVDRLEIASVGHRDTNQVRLQCGKLRVAEPYLVRELLMRIWEANGWPLGPMTHDKWSQLFELASASSTAKKIVLPGNVVAERSGEDLLLRRD